MSNSEYVKDIGKGILNSKVEQCIPPESVKRRYEPTIGVNKHNDRIHRESKYADSSKNLPYTFRKPPKPLGKSSLIKCDSCGNISCGTTKTVGIICSSCGKFSSVSEVE